MIMVHKDNSKCISLHFKVTESDYKKLLFFVEKLDIPKSNLLYAGFKGNIRKLDNMLVDMFNDPEKLKNIIKKRSIWLSSEFLKDLEGLPIEQTGEIYGN